jgi:hypothetical protein
MYARLVVGPYNFDVSTAIRDIGRLICSPSPSLANVYAFSNTLSTIVDATPAGWSYVGSNLTADQPTLATGNSTSNPVFGTAATYNWCFSAPTLSGNQNKYLVLGNVSQANGAGRNCLSLTGASNASSVGILTNQGTRFAIVANTDQTYARNVGIAASLGGSIIHVIANQRHCTIIEEGKGLMGLWEYSSADLNTFYNSAPFVTYCHSNSSVSCADGSAVGTTITVGASAAYQNSIHATVYNLSTFTGINYPAYDPLQTVLQTGQTQFGTPIINLNHLAQASYNANAAVRSDSLSSTGVPRYQVVPAFIELPSLGYPTQFISGTTPIYWARGNIGASGDTTVINGVTYTLFNCGTGYSVFMTTGN